MIVGKKEFFSKYIFIVLIIIGFIFLGHRVYIASNPGQTAISQIREVEQRSSVVLAGNVGVALVTNIGNGFVTVQEKYDPTLGKMLAMTDLQDVNGIVVSNTKEVDGYMSILSGNFMQELDKSTNRAEALEQIIQKYSDVYRRGDSNIQILGNRREQIVIEYRQKQQELAQIKSELGQAFSNKDSSSLSRNVAAYEAKKAEMEKLRIEHLFVVKYIDQYIFLNNYNKEFLDTIINNRDAIVKNSYVVIPSSGDGVLQDLKLLISEQEYKNGLIDSEG